MGLVTWEFGNREIGDGSLGLERWGRQRDNVGEESEERERKNEITYRLVTFVFRIKDIIIIKKKS